MALSSSHPVFCKLLANNKGVSSLLFILVMFNVLNILFLYFPYQELQFQKAMIRKHHIKIAASQIEKLYESALTSDLGWQQTEQHADNYDGDWSDFNSPLPIDIYGPDGVMIDKYFNEDASVCTLANPENNCFLVMSITHQPVADSATEIRKIETKLGFGTKYATYDSQNPNSRGILSIDVSRYQTTRVKRLDP